MPDYDRLTAHRGVGNPRALVRTFVWAFTPSAVPNLVAWYKADSLALSDGTLVASWPDSSGITGALVGTGTQRPTFKTAIRGALPVVRFDGVANGLRAAAMTTDAYTIFVASNPTGQQMVLEHSDTSNANDGCYLYNNVANNAQVRRSAAIQIINNQAAGWMTGAHVIESRYGGAATKFSIARDGTVLATSAGADLSAASTSQPLNVGARAQSTLFCAVDVFEIAVYSRLLSAGELTQVESYLRTRWGTP